jgi:hypothetical protein
MTNFHEISLGQTVRSREFSEGRERSLMLITAGNVAVYPSPRIDWALLPYYNPGAHRAVIMRGKGDYLGVLDFMLGTGEDHFDAHVVAMTTSVKCLKLKIKHQTKNQPPFFTEFLKPHEVYLGTR